MPATNARPAGRRVLLVVLILGAAWLQRRYLSEIPLAIGAIGDAHLGWVGLAALASGSSYLMAALAMIGSVPRRLPFRRAFQVQVASGLTTLATPAGLGAAGINVWFLERVGLGRRDAIAATLRNALVGGVVHAIGLGIVLVVLPELLPLDLPDIRGLGAHSTMVTGGVLALSMVIGWRQRERVRVGVEAARREWAATVTLLRRPDRAPALIGGSVGLSLAYGITFWASAQAIGVPLNLPTAIAIELVVEALGGLSGSPGGLGVVEAASLQALVLVGTGPAAALAVVVLHRLLTFWLPALPGTFALRGLQASLAAPRRTHRLQPAHRPGPGVPGGVALRLERSGT